MECHIENETTIDEEQTINDTPNYNRPMIRGITIRKRECTALTQMIFELFRAIV